MIGLAAILACTVVLPLLFDLSPAMQAIFEGVNYVIITAFVAEYVLKLYVARSRTSFVTDWWHVLDLLIIIIALLDFSKLGFLPYLVAEQGKLSPVLRLFRALLRVMLAFALAGRTAERVIPLQLSKDGDRSKSELQIATLDQEGQVKKGLAEGLGCPIVEDGQALWVDFQNVGKLDLGFIEEATFLPHDLLESKLIRESFPRIDYVEGLPTIFLWDSRIEPADTDSDEINISTKDLLIVCAGANIITLSAGNGGLFDRISSQKLPLEGGEFAVRVLYSLLRQKINDYEEVVHCIEGKTIRFEEIPVNRTSPQFLEETFYFKKEIQKTISNLWHFNQVLHHIMNNKSLLLKGIKDPDSQKFDGLHAESEYMYETAQNIRDSLISLIELHINTVSYDMNKVMKVIAVITCLAIIPSIIGGLLGVNLIDQPYPLKITEVLFLIISSMLIGMYVFYKMDWLK